MTGTTRFTHEHVRRFADASGDRNPLHIDDAFARTTPYGRCMVHGALVTIAALGSVDAELLERAETITILFKQPVFPDGDYRVEPARSGGPGVEVAVARGARPAVVVEVSISQERLPAIPQGLTGAPLRAAPARLSIADVVEELPAVAEGYGCDLDALAALAAEVGAPAVPRTILVWLAAASYTIGMIVPGEDAVFAGARIDRTTANGSGALVGTVSEVDDRTGLIVLDVTFEHGQTSARMELQAFLQTPVPPPDRASVARYLQPSNRLAGRNILVVGASRGLGAALAGALAEQGATVWAAFARSRGRAEALRSEFGENRINLLQFDAGDPAAARAGIEPLRGGGPLDGIALCAAPPLQEGWLHPETTEANLRFVEASLALALVPLAECSDLLQRDGWIALVSTSALGEPPDGWPHYVVAKSAIEGLAAYCRRHVAPRVLVARPPRMWTDSMNTPLGRLAAVPKEQVAAAIVRWALAEGEAGASRTLLPDELAALAPEPVSA